MSLIDKKIIGTRDFKVVVRSILKNMFKIQADTNKIYVDLNSCLSVMFRYEDIDSQELTDVVSDNIESFLQKYLEDGVKITILFTLEPSAAHRKIFPEWCKERNERVTYAKSVFLQKLILSLNAFSNDNPLIKVVNTRKVHPAAYVYTMEKSAKSRFTVMSKDVVFQCLPLRNMVVFTGVHYIDMEDPYKDLPDDITLPDNTGFFLPYYLAIRGDERNEYKGVSGYGPKLTVKYLNENKLRIKSGSDHALKEHCDKYVQLYEINKILENCKEEFKEVKIK